MRTLVIFLFIVTLSLAKESSYFISLGSYESHIDATKELSKVDNDPFIVGLQKRYGFKVTLRKERDGFHILLVGFNSALAIPTLYDILKHDYLSLKTNYRIVEKKESSDLLWFIILFVMFAILGLVFVLRSSNRYDELQDEYKRLKNLKDHLSAKHDEVLSNLGYKIESSTQDMISARDKIINEPIKEFTQEVVEKKFKSIKDTDKILTDTTDQIIDFLKAKSGKLKLHNKRFDLNRLLDTISSFVSRNYRGKSVELIFEVNVEIPRYIIGDIKRLNEMLISIIDYSYQHTTSGYIKVVLSKFDHIADQPMIEFKVLDSSVGVKKAQQEALFTPFHNKETQGGLFIVKEFTKLMGGKMEFVSRYGKGNTFAINIPLVVDDESKEGYKLSSDVVSIQELENKYVGVIDKSESVANALSKSFLHFMKNVSTIAHYSLEDFDVLNRYDLILIEHSMITNKLLDTFKKIQETREYYVVGTHSLLNNEYIEIIDRSISQYISKPLTPAFARKVFLDEFSRVKLVDSESEMIYMENMGGDFHSNLPKQYPDPMIETKNTTKEFFKDFFGSSILIINANRINQDIFRDLIHASGIKCAIASNSDETMEQLG
ncbi:MAG: HAMP domain-containing sensor histidine kinase, partial [Campylobacterota bacterium]|nr:HAMP domain-containing sensor histidine kinase [Campylobacterota bacterium]